MSSSSMEKQAAELFGGAEREATSFRAHSVSASSEKSPDNTVLDEKSDHAANGTITAPTPAANPKNAAAAAAEGFTAGPVTKQTSKSEPVYVTGFKLYIVLIAVTLTVFLMLLDVSIIATAIPYITNDFHSLTDVGWYGSAYLLASSALQPLTGKIYTYYDAKWTFICFAALFELGSLLCGVAQSSKMLIVGRAVAGMGGSGLINGAVTILAACVPLAGRGKAMGIMMSFSMIGNVVGPLIGGAFTEYSTWRWCFYLNLPVGGVVGLLLLFISIPSVHHKPAEGSSFWIILRKLDPIGFTLFAPAAIQCLLALQWGGTTFAWRSATIIGLFCGSGGTLAVFIVWEYFRGDDAMIPLAMVRQRIVWSSAITISLFFGSMMITNYYLPIYFQAIRGVSPATSGVYLLPTVISQIVFALVSGALVGKLGYYLPWTVAGGALVAIGTGLLGLFTPTTSTGKWIGFQILIGAGRGCALQMPLLAVQTQLPMKQLSVGIALIVFAQMFGGALYLALAQTDFTSSLKTLLPQYAPTANVGRVIQAGATNYRSVVTPDQFDGVLTAFNLAVRHVYYLGAALGAAMFVTAWGMGWKSVKAKPKQPGPKAEIVPEVVEEAMIESEV